MHWLTVSDMHSIRMEMTDFDLSMDTQRLASHIPRLLTTSSSPRETLSTNEADRTVHQMYVAPQTSSLLRTLELPLSRCSNSSLCSSIHSVSGIV